MNKISIIGGGIGGLALAASLQHFKISYQLYETASSLGEVGAGIGISESTVEILNMLGLGELLSDKGRYVRDAIIVDNKCSVIRKLPIENGGFCIHRMDLIDILRKNISDENLHLNYKLSSYKKAKNCIELFFENGETIKTEFVIVADGINSKIRQHLYPKIQKRYSGQTIWRGIANIDLPINYQNTYLEFWGRNLRFATIPLNDRQYYWYAVQEADEGGKDNMETLKTDLQKLFTNHVSEINQIIEHTENIIRNDMFDLKPHNFNWFSDKVIFIGDAIHATTPNLAQGGCQAIEDAFYLAMLINKYGLIEQTFFKYQHNRIEKVNYIVNQSWSFGKIAHSKSEIFNWVIQKVFRFLPKSYFIKQYKKLIDISYIKTMR
jgi:2-polyprenyl-6-methoxyphenol hydroxylase-like FAD-dependent oxidoreductase